MFDIFVDPMRVYIFISIIFLIAVTFMTIAGYNYGYRNGYRNGVKTTRFQIRKNIKRNLVEQYSDIYSK